MSDTPPTDPPDDPAQLRSKLDKALTENRQLKVANALHESGLSHLSEVQRQAMMLTIPKGTELTSDALKAQATALGFPLEVAPPQPPPTEPTPPATSDPNQPDPNQPPSDSGPTFLTPAPGSLSPDPRVQASITGLTEQEYAHIMAIRGGNDGGTFEATVDKATSKAEVLAAIQQQGKGAGLVLESDLD